MKKQLNDFFSSRALPRTSIFLIDLIIIVLCNISVYFFRFEFENFSLMLREEGIISTSVLLFFNSIAFIIFKTSRGILRYSTFRDLLRIFYAITFGYFSSGMVLLLISKGYSPFVFSFTTLFAIYIINLLFMAFVRIVVKELYETISVQRMEAIDVFIYGTKQAGISVAKALNANRELNYMLKGFITDEDYMVGKELFGVRVYPNDENLFRVLQDKDVKTVIVSPNKLQEIRNSEQLARFVDNDISLLTTPPISEWNAHLSQKEYIKDVQIEDLLPREPIQINLRGIACDIEGKCVMVTGAAGSIGSEIVRQVAAFNPYRIVLVDQAETPLHDMRLELQKRWINVQADIVVADITNQTRMEKIFAKNRPQLIFHAAAYKHVPMMEDNVSESVQNNILGTKNIADLAVKYKASKFVMVSTDKAVNPSNVMGCSKRICEIYVQSLSKQLERRGKGATQFITTRFGNVLGSNGSVIPLFREQIKRGGPVTVTHPEIIRYFMTIPEACQLVLEAGSMGKGGEIFLFDMGKPVKIVDLARRMIRLSGYTGVRIEFTGLRHGEKLYEELLATEECTKKTHHEKIMIAEVREYDYQEVCEQIEELIKISYEYDDMRIVKKMKEIVPEFHSINSPYETIDHLIQEESNQNAV